MRRIRFFIILMGLTFLPFSCESFLDLSPENEIPEEEALQSTTDLRYLASEAFLKLSQSTVMGGRIQSYSELLTDHIDGSSLDGDFLVIYIRRSSIFEGTTSNLWNDTYKMIFLANTILENLDKADNDDDRKFLEGQAKFLRGLAHFELVRLFGFPYGYTTDNSHLGIAIRLTTEQVPLNRSTVKEVYNQILLDFKDAEDLLPPSYSDELLANSYPTTWAAKGYLAKVHFQMNDFENAYKYANDVIENGPVNFNDSETEYANKFSVDGSGEAVFLLSNQTKDKEGTSSLANRGEDFGDYRTDQNAPPRRAISNKIYQLGTQDPNDRRSAVWYEEVGAIKATAKFNTDFIPTPILTITEMKLTRAESAGELGTNLNVATQDLKDIMDRAYGTDTKIAPEEAEAIILKSREERRLEMVFEGDYGQQLKRRGALGEEIIIRGAPWDCPGSIIQFPTAEIGNTPGFVKNREGGC